MINHQLRTILVHAKEQNKWVQVKLLTAYGMHTGIVQYMDNKGWIHIKQDYQHGTQIKLTTEGWRALRNTVSA